MKATVSKSEGIVSKRGTDQVQLQGDLMSVIGAEVFPKVYKVTEAGYDMEELVMAQPETPNVVVNLAKSVIDLCERKIWSVEIDSDTDCSDDWIEQVYDWSYNNYPWISAVVTRYPILPAFTGKCMTHGNLTLEHVGFRGNQMLLMSPEARTGFFPPNWHVDIGKLLLSLNGWEHRLTHGAYPQVGVDDMVPLPSKVMPEPIQISMCQFWASVHFMLEAESRGDADLTTYCENQSKRMMSYIQF